MVYAIGCSQYVRIRWTVGTTATFQVVGEAHQLMATPAHLRAEAPAFVLSEVSQETIAYGLISASTDAEDALSHLHPVPLTRWSASVTTRVARIALYHCVKHRGFQVDGTDEVFYRDYKDAMKWLESYKSNENRSPDVQPESNLVPKSSTGNPDRPNTFRPKFTDNWGDF